MLGAAGPGAFATLMKGSQSLAGAGGAQVPSMMSQIGRGLGGAMGGFGQAMMDQNFRRTYSTARGGGYSDLMQNQRIGDFIRGNDWMHGLKRKVSSILTDPSLETAERGIVGGVQ